MLVAMALTLILVYSIAHFYAIVGDAVKDGRAMIELNQQLRAVVERLKDDLDRVTISAVPWADEGGAAGYIEINEGRGLGGSAPAAGPGSDWDVNGNYLPDAEVEQSDPISYPEWALPNVTNLLGDIDDWLGLTIRAGNVPFSGQTVKTWAPLPLTVTTNAPAAANLDGLPQFPGPAANPSKTSNAPITTQITAPYAEVAWWTSFSDTNGNRTWDLNETRFLHRRQLLIRPDLNVLHPNDPNFGSSPVASAPYFCRLPIPPSAAELNNPDRIYLYDLLQYCDLSVRPVLSGGYVYFIANSLSDLCRRENRFMHQSIVSGSFPYPLDLNPNNAGDLNPNLMPDNFASISTTTPRHPGSNNLNAFSQYRWVLFDGGRKGEDVILSNALAFDVRVFDPDAVLRSAVSDITTGPTNPPVNAYQFSANALQPGDPGYARALLGGYPALGTGAYVDPGYGIALVSQVRRMNPTMTVQQCVNQLFFGSPPALGSSRFAGYPAAPQQYFAAGFAGLPTAPLLTYPGALYVPGAYQTTLGFTWDSWTLSYERDGINQDNAVEAALSITPTIDEGTDGLDNPDVGGAYINGIDDVSERETVPPYPSALRGIQVRIRVYEPQTRQVRQATVESDFIPE
jgi:hypothetical protein